MKEEIYAQLNKLFDQIDLTHNKKITKLELHTFLDIWNLTAVITGDDINLLFEKIDIDNDQEIDRFEFIKFMTQTKEDNPLKSIIDKMAN